MNTDPVRLSRRRFLQATGAASVGALLFGPQAWAADAATPKVAKKKFGRTGVDVSKVGLGCMFDILNNQIILRQALDHGVTYWDTAASYERMGSESGIGLFLQRNPSARKEIFLVTKGHAPDPSRELAESLERLKTDYIDLYFIHNATQMSQIDRPSVKAFAAEAKRSGKIKFFGFSVHSNMAEMLAGAAKLDWIDGIMFSYSYREQHNTKLQAAIEACAKAGIGLTAMKTMGNRQGADSSAEAALLAPLKEKGYTPGQAKLKVVMEHPHIACACVQMPNLKFCRENIAAALDRTTLGAAERTALEAHARATCQGYCAGCSQICESAIAGAVPIRDVMRHLMYHHHYAELDARAMFADLPAAARAQLGTVDFSAAEHVCPQRMPIGELMREASRVLA